MPDPNKMGNLTEEETNAIAKAVREEAEAEEQGKVKDPELNDDGTPKAKSDEGKEKDTSKSEEEKATEAQEQEAKRQEEEKKLLEAKDEDLSEEDKTKKAGIVKVKEEAEVKAKEEANKATEATKKAFEEEVTAYSKASEMSVEDARKDLESIGKIQEKYKNDPKQLAKAHLHLQRFSTKAQEELKALQEARAAMPPQEITHEFIVKLIDNGKIAINGKVATKEEIVAKYREQEPDISETLEDDAVLKLAARKMKDDYFTQQKELAAQISVQAKDKMSKLISELSEEDKQFLPEIKPVLDLQKDAAVMKDSFSLSDFVLWAKGKKYDAAIKEADEKGFKRGLDEAKILGEKKPGGEGKVKDGDGKPKHTLTEAKKKRALEMYDGLELTDDQKYSAYLEYIADDNKETEKKKK